MRLPWRWNMMGDCDAATRHRHASPSLNFKAFDLCGDAAVTSHVNAPNYRERGAFPWRWRIIHAVKVKFIQLACVNTASLTDFLVYVISPSTDLNEEGIRSWSSDGNTVKCNKRVNSLLLNRMLFYYDYHNKMHRFVSSFSASKTYWWCAWVISFCFEIKIFKSKTKRQNELTVTAFLFS